MPDFVSVPADGDGKAVKGQRADDGAEGRTAVLRRRAGGVVEVGGHDGPTCSVFRSRVRKMNQCKSRTRPNIWHSSANNSIMLYQAHLWFCANPRIGLGRLKCGHLSDISTPTLQAQPCSTTVQDKLTSTDDRTVRNHFVMRKAGLLRTGQMILPCTPLPSKMLSDRPENGGRSGICFKGGGHLLST